MPGKDPKITFGGYQKEGLAVEDQKFYSELLHPITAIRIGGSFHWEVPLIAVNIGGTFFRPKVNNAMLDTGTSIIVMGQEDLDQIENAICKFINDTESFQKLDPPPRCVRDGMVDRLIIDGCAKSV